MNPAHPLLFLFGAFLLPASLSATLLDGDFEQAAQRGHIVNQSTWVPRMGYEVGWQGMQGRQFSVTENGLIYNPNALVGKEPVFLGQIWYEGGTLLGPHTLIFDLSEMSLTHMPNRKQIEDIVFSVEIYGGHEPTILSSQNNYARFSFNDADAVTNISRWEKLDQATFDIDAHGSGTHASVPLNLGTDHTYDLYALRLNIQSATIIDANLNGSDVAALGNIVIDNIRLQQDAADGIINGDVARIPEAASAPMLAAGLCLLQTARKRKKTV